MQFQQLIIVLLNHAYNALLTTHLLLDHTVVSLMLQFMVYVIKNLNIERPSYDNLDGLIAKVMSSMTESLRLEGEMNVDLNEFQTNLVPLPRLHFMTISMAPILTKEKAETEKNCH